MRPWCIVKVKIEENTFRWNIKIVKGEEGGIHTREEDETSL